MRSRIALLLSALSLLTVSATAHGQDSGQFAAAAAAQKVQPGDVVRLVIWREPDLSGEFPVERNGSVVFPKVGVYSVGEETAESLEERLLADFGKYLRNPSIDVVVLRRVKVMGAVQRPGLYNLDPTMTIADVLALAGGAAPNGRRDRVELVRDGERLITELDATTPVAASPVQSGDEIFVPEKNWLVRNANIWTPLVTTLMGVVVTLLVR